jgi:uncharacterized protein YgiM (DUF1202 family)
MLVVFGLTAGHGAQGTTLTVTKKETKLRTQKRLFAPAVCDLKEGDRVTQNGSEGAWRLVTYKTKNGWIHESDVTEKKDVRLSGQGVRENYSASEQAAARKGFNPEVEREYRNSNPNLAAAFTKVDAIQARSVVEAEIEKFLREGRLLKETKP